MYHWRHCPIFDSGPFQYRFVNQGSRIGHSFQNSDGKLESTEVRYLDSSLQISTGTHRVSVIISNNFLIIYLITFVLTEDESNKM